MSRAERGAVLTLLALAVLGHLGRAFLASEGAPGGAFLPGQVAADLEAQRARAVTESRPLAPGETVDPDRASAADLPRLPGVGMRLAKEIVSDREVRGFFGSAGGLDRVRGIGPAKLSKLEPFLRFSSRTGPTDTRVDLNRATQVELQALPGIGPARAQAIVAYRERHGPFADLAGLAQVPGISRALAARWGPLAVVR